MKGHEAVYAERGTAHPDGASWKYFAPEVSRVREAVIAEARRIFPTEFEILVDIKGIGDETAARILAESMGVERFSNGHAFAAFMGLDPRVKESGTSVRGKGAMTKSGSVILRQLFGWTGMNILRRNECFRRRFEYDVERGKPRGVAYGSIARRLAVTLWTCLSKKEPFNPALVGVTAEAACPSSPAA